MITDKRVIKTRTNIKNALMELAEDREISKISVSDLAAKALINRSTFYLHYADVEEVITDIENGMADSLASFVDNFLIDDVYTSIQSVFRQLFNRLNENERMKRYLIYSTCSDHVISRLKELFVEMTTKTIVRDLNIPEKNIIFPLTYAAAGIIDCYVKWVRDDNSSLSFSETMDKVSEITKRIVEIITDVNT